MSDTTPTTWTALREAREAAGLSQGALARQAGVDPAQVSKWEAGKVTPSDEAIEKLRVVLPDLESPGPPAGEQAARPGDPGKEERAKAFGAWIREARMGKDWTIGDAARVAGLPRSTWSNIENGQQHGPSGRMAFIPGWDVTVRAAEILGLDVTEALKRAGHGDREQAPMWSSRRVTQHLASLDAAHRMALVSLAEGLAEPTIHAGGTVSVDTGEGVRYRGEITEVKASRDGKTIRITVTTVDGDQ